MTGSAFDADAQVPVDTGMPPTQPSRSRQRRCAEKTVDPLSKSGYFRGHRGCCTAGGDIGRKKPGIAAGRGFLFRLWGLVFQHMCLESLKRFRADHVLDPAGVFRRHLGTDAQGCEPVGEQGMALIDFFSDTRPLSVSVIKPFLSISISSLARRFFIAMLTLGLEKESPTRYRWNAPARAVFVK